MESLLFVSPETKYSSNLKRLFSRASEGITVSQTGLRLTQTPKSAIKTSQYEPNTSRQLISILLLDVNYWQIWVYFYLYF